jgi:Sec-independent protein translocase protein TatA
MDPKVWTLLVIVIVVCLVIVGVLKLLTGVVADRRTRRIIQEGMDPNAPGDEEESGEGEKDGEKDDAKEKGHDEKDTQ